MYKLGCSSLRAFNKHRASRLIRELTLDVSNKSYEFDLLLLLLLII